MFLSYDATIVNATNKMGNLCGSVNMLEKTKQTMNAFMNDNENKRTSPEKLEGYRFMEKRFVT